MCKTVSFATICPVCFDPSPISADGNGPQSETVLCPIAFDTKQICNLTTSTGDNGDNGTDLPYPHFNKLDRTMCSRCQPLFEDLSNGSNIAVHYAEPVVVGTPAYRGSRPGAPCKVSSVKDVPSRRFTGHPKMGKADQELYETALETPTDDRTRAMKAYIEVAAKYGWRSTDPYAHKVSPEDKQHIMSDFHKIRYQDSRLPLGAKIDIRKLDSPCFKYDGEIIGIPTEAEIETIRNALPRPPLPVFENGLSPFVAGDWEKAKAAGVKKVAEAKKAAANKVVKNTTAPKKPGKKEPVKNKDSPKKDTTKSKTPAKTATKKDVAPTTPARSLRRR